MDTPATTAQSLSSNWRRFRRSIPGVIKGVLRRQSEILLPNREARQYQSWMTERLRARALLYRDPLEPGLLSVLTPVWNGSPVRYLKILAQSLAAQNPEGACEWVILDNGCTEEKLLRYLSELNAFPWIKVFHVPTNIGIIRGLRHCLEHATGRYALPIDADDYLYPDALRVVTSFLHRAGFPPLLYTDEDKVIGTRFFQPYLKPDWDPVLLLNSAYIAHLGIIDRTKGLELGAYTDVSTEGSPDWDLFVRFMIAGTQPVHIPEVLYSWRVHAHSTADDAAIKPYVHSSQQAVLQRFLDTRPECARFSIEYSPLLGGAAHWHFCRARQNPRPFLSVVLTARSGSTESVREGTQYAYPEIRRVALDRTAKVASLADCAREMAERDGFIHLVGADVEIDNDEWPWEALGLFELHPDTVMIGGRIRNKEGLITEGGRTFGFAGACGCPNRGRSFLDPGYFTQMWKQRSVSAVSTQFAVIDAAFLVELLEKLPEEASLPFLGAWAGAHAARSSKRVVYSPFLSGVSDLDWDTLVSRAEQRLFIEMNQANIPDRRFYSRFLCLDKAFALCPHPDLNIRDGP